MIGEFCKIEYNISDIEISGLKWGSQGCRASIIQLLPMYHKQITGAHTLIVSEGGDWRLWAQFILCFSFFKSQISISRLIYLSSMIFCPFQNRT